MKSWPRSSPRNLTLLTLLLVALVPAVARAQAPALIDRQVFFGNPTRTTVRISPDGTRLSYIAPSPDQVLNVWVQTLGKSDARMVSHDTHRGIRVQQWAFDGRHLLFQQDIDGNENFHVYSVDLASDSVRDLTPHEGVRAQSVLLDKQHPDEMLVAMNLRDKHLFDEYRVSISSGVEKLEGENPGDVVDWRADPEFVIRAALASNQKDGSTVLRVREGATVPWRDLITWPAEENGDFDGFTADGKAGYVESSIGTDVTRLAKVDLASGQELETIATDPRCDVGPVMVNPNTYSIEAVSFNYLKNEWKVLDPAVAEDFAALAKVHPGEISVVSRDRADDKWIVAFLADDGPLSYYAFDRSSRKATFLFVNRPELEHLKLAKMEPMVIESRDGQKMVSYLTLPLGVSAKNLPLVLFPHGGPWARDNWGYVGLIQFLANRGCAVLQVNFRSSTGFGKKFLHLGDRQWGQTMQDDLTDAVKWAIGRGIADPKKVAIMGGSYGGYATLAGLAFTPGLYACGVDIVGPSNLKTLLAAIPPYWATQRKIFDLRMGEVDKDSLFNRKVSPLFHVDQMRAPVLIGQGLNDPRVNVRESEQIVAALRARGVPVDYVVYTDEGHGFARPENNLDFFGRTEVFLAKHLGTRAQPLEPVKGAMADVR